MIGRKCSPLDSARDWLRRGFHPIPIPYRSKKPIIAGWPKLRLTEADLQKHFNGQPQNIGVLLGDRLGTTDVDLDSSEAIEAATILLPETNLIFGRKSKPKSHYFYHVAPLIPSLKFLDPLRASADEATLIELRCQKKDGSAGFQTVVPCSTHECGEAIEFAPGCDGPAANIDAHVLVRQVARIAAASLLARYFPKPKSGRNDAFLAGAGVLVRSGWTAEDAIEFNFAIYRILWGSQADHAACVSEVRPTFEKYASGAETTGIPKLKTLIDERVVKAALKWLNIDTPQSTSDRRGGHDHAGEAGRYRPTPQPSDSTIDLIAFPFTDSGNSERLIALYGRDLRFCAEMKKWGAWDGRRWVFQDPRRVKAFAKRTMRLMYAQTAAIEDKEVRETAERHARKSESAAAISAMLTCAEYEDGIPVAPDELDTHPFLLNFLNGTVDLITGVLQPHRREDMITKLIHYNYRPAETCPTWLAFLHQAMGGGPNASKDAQECAKRLVDYLQRAVGYSLTGSTIEKAIFVPFGLSDTGKSTTLNTVRQLISEYSALLQVDTLMARTESNNTQADLADLRGARFVQTSETEEGQRLAQGKLKRISQGMGKIKAVRKYENPIEFPETHKLWMDTNRKPVIPDGDDDATFNRLHPIPFMIKITKIDREMPVKLLRQAEGILAWGVVGATRWYESGLCRPTEIDSARDQWRSDSDQIGRYLTERCVQGASCSVRTSALFADYKRWAEDAGEKHIINNVAFRNRILNHGFQVEHKTKGDIYTGLALKEDERDDAYDAQKKGNDAGRHA